MQNVQKPRLGDRDGLRIEIQSSAVQTYQQTRRETTGVRMTPAEAEEELDDVLRQSHVVRSEGNEMQVRGRVNRLGVDVQSDLIRVSPTHVRCYLSTVRKLATKPDQRAGTKHVHDYGADGRAGKKVGYIRIGEDGEIECRRIVEHDDGTPPVWHPLTHDHWLRPYVQRDPIVLAWLRKFGREL